MMFLGLRAGELLYRCVVALTCHLKVPSAEGEARVGEGVVVLVPKLPPAQAKAAATAPVSKLWERRSTHSPYPT